MGAQAIFGSVSPFAVQPSNPLLGTMVKAMKAMKAMKFVSKTAKGRAMPKGELFGAIESTSGIKKKEVKAIFGVTMIKLKKKPATKAGKRFAFGKEVFVKAKPAKTVVKCYTVKALKDEF